MSAPDPEKAEIRARIRLQLAEGELSMQNRKRLAATARQDWSEVRVLEFRERKAADKVARYKKQLEEFESWKLPRV